MGSITARSKTVFARNDFGRFARECDLAADRTAIKTAKEGAKVSRALAPSGNKRDKRPQHRTKLKKSIKSRKIGFAKAEWYSTSGHALHVEFGTAVHLIHGKMSFDWENAGTWFVWDNEKFGPRGSGKGYENWDDTGAIIVHPGADAQPFLRPAFDQVARRKMLKIAKSEYPG